MPSLYTYRSLISIFQDGVFRTQYFAWLNSNGPNPLHGQIQMSAAWGKFEVEFPREGTAEVFKCLTFAGTAPSPLSV